MTSGTLRSILIVGAALAAVSVAACNKAPANTAENSAQSDANAAMASANAASNSASAANAAANDASATPPMTAPASNGQ